MHRVQAIPQTWENAEKYVCNALFERAGCARELRPADVSEGLLHLKSQLFSQQYEIVLLSNLFPIAKYLPLFGNFSFWKDTLKPDFFFLRLTAICSNSNIV